MREQIIETLTKVTPFNKDEIEASLEIPPKDSMGDYALPCFVLAKQYKQSPQAIAKEITQSLNAQLPQEIHKVEAQGPYVNIFLNMDMFAHEVLTKTTIKAWGTIKQKRRSVVLEFSQPNTHKAFHVGHIRGTSIGESLARIFTAAHNTVTRVNYSGDTGMHIAKWIWCYQNFHKDEPLTNDESWIAGIYVDAVKRLDKDTSLQAQVDTVNKKIEDKTDKTINELWKKTRKLSIDSWKHIYKELNTTFEKHYFESEMEQPGKQIAKDLINQGIAKVDDGATIIDFTEHREEHLSVWVLLRKDKTVLYSAKDIALALQKDKDYHADYYLLTVADEQTLHFMQLKKTLTLMQSPIEQKYDFMTFGLVRFPSGKMSSRTGDNTLYSDFITDIKEIAKQKIQERQPDISTTELNHRAQALAIAAIKYSMLKQDPKKAIIFDPHADVSFEGDTGPYLLYAYARANSILKKAPKKKPITIKNINESERALIKNINELPKVIKKAYDNHTPNTIANYAYSLAQSFNEFYHNSPVIGSDEQGFRTELTRAFTTTLKKALQLLGIETLEEM